MNKAKQIIILIGILVLILIVIVTIFFPISSGEPIKLVDKKGNSIKDGI